MAVLSVMSAAQFDFDQAQTAAALVAMTSNFYLNNRTTYRDRRLHGLAALKGLMVFYVICFIGLMSNLGVADFLYTQHLDGIVAGFIGSLIGAIWNFTFSSQLLWRK